jgi:Uma2 family endonuclease
MANAAIISTMAERLVELGSISADRVRSRPAPGTATCDDLIAANEGTGPLCELIDGTLVEKAVGFEASVVAMTIARILGFFVSARKLGVVSGPDGMFRLLANTVRGPDVAYLARDRFPGGAFPTDAFPALSPNLVVEVLSPSNTQAEMSRKRIEYFHSGVQLVWIVDCASRSVAVYTSPSSVTELGDAQSIDGGMVLPDFTSPIADFFADLASSL